MLFDFVKIANYLCGTYPVVSAASVATMRRLPGSLGGQGGDTLQASSNGARLPLLFAVLILLEPLSTIVAAFLRCYVKPLVTRAGRRGVEAWTSLRTCLAAVSLRIYACGEFRAHVSTRPLVSERVWMRGAEDPPPPFDHILHDGLGFEQILACVEIIRSTLRRSV